MSCPLKVDEWTHVKSPKPVNDFETLTDCIY